MLSCSQDNDLEDTSLTGFRITLTDGVQTVARKTPEEIGAPASSNFTVRVTSNSSGNVLYDGQYTDEVIKAPAGTYTVSAFYGENDPLAYDAPYYYGEITDAEVTDGTTSVTIGCSVANAFTTIYIDEDNQEKFDALYSEYYVEVAVDEYSLTLPYREKSAYYQAGTVPVFTFIATIADNGQDVSYELTSDDLTEDCFTAGKHCMITLEYLDAEESGAMPTITKVETENVTIEDTLPLSWLPSAQVTSDDFDDDNTITIYETVGGDAATITLDVAYSLQELVFTLNFNDENLSSYSDVTYTLSEMTDDEISALEDIGISLPSIGDESPTITLSADFMNSLLADNDNTVSNSICIASLKSNDKTTTTDATYNVNVEKPVFSISVDDINIWSKTLTVNDGCTVSDATKGDESVISADLKITDDGIVRYEYLTEDGDWEDFTDYTLLELASRPSSGTCDVRALYRGELSSEVLTVTLEEQTQLDNSEMENWYTSKGGSFYQGGYTSSYKYTYYYFYPYSSGQSDVWWATNNERSQDGTLATLFGVSTGSRVCFAPCVSYSTAEYQSGSRSAFIFTNGHSSGAGSSSLKIGLFPDYALPGRFFIGTYDWDGDDETITTGHSFTTRPTSFTFYYKYTPKNTDSFEAYIEVCDDDGDAIASGTFTSSETVSSWTQATISLSYPDSAPKAASIYVLFLSSTKTSFDEEDFDDYEEEGEPTTYSFPNMSSWQVWMGSRIWIDTLELVYDK